MKHQELDRSLVGRQGALPEEVGARERGLEVRKGIPELNLSSIEAVSCWKYEPARKDGKPGPVDFTVVVRTR